MAVVWTLTAFGILLVIGVVIWVIVSISKSNKGFSGMTPMDTDGIFDKPISITTPKYLIGEVVAWEAYDNHGEPIRGEGVIRSYELNYDEFTYYVSLKGFKLLTRPLREKNISGTIPPKQT